MSTINFSPGPSIVAREVLEQAAQALLGVPEVHGLSIAEISHRLPYFEGIVRETEATLRRLMGIPDTHVVLFLQGGARGQFAQLALNWLGGAKVGAYIDTGVWSRAAFDDAKTLGDARILATGEGNGYRELPDVSDLALPEGVAYVHTTSNNTIYGTQWPTMPTFAAPHISDMSSDILSRPIDVSRFAMIYAGAQKNAGISGLTLCILERSWMDAARQDIPSIWQYRVQHANDSMYNTPPTFAIYVTLLALRWFEKQGGVAAIAANNTAKANALYAAIDGSDGFYRGYATPAHRSQMNVTFRLATEDLEKTFVAEAEAAGLHHLKGHRKAGGIRASLYNAMSLEGVERLIAFMAAFKSRH
ncbi:MAG: 3-phosphoserine/phosphohydroxythreonine transaminase [Deltaproteobacteria bacterium]|nr:3-phosphoserine/phosphohydroxythreonine transaminase [Deltaproteobacteria bacterium]